MDAVADAIYGASAVMTRRRTKADCDDAPTAERAVAIVGVGAILPDAPDAGAFWRNVTRGPLRDQRRRPGALGPGALLRRRPAGAREDLLEDRRLGARLGVGPARLEAADPAARSRDAMDDAQKWAVACTRMALLDYGWPERPLDLERTAVDPRQRDVRREALPDRAAHHLPRARARARAAPRASPRCPPTCARRSRASCTRNMDALAAADHRGHDAGRARQLPRRADRQPLQPARAELHRRRGLRLGDGGDGRVDRGPASQHEFDVGDHRRRSTATWARRRSSSSARSARCRPPARGPTPTAPTAS